MATKCHCPRCSEDPLFTYCEQFREETEARHVLRLPKAERALYYGNIGKKRGQEAMKQLIENVKAAYQKGRTDA